jgi:hypothetical protein
MLCFAGSPMKKTWQTTDREDDEDDDEADDG